MPDSDHPVDVSVCVVTYNQEEYIENCILSVLQQKTAYSFEIIVGDDASTDKTREILKRLQAEFPEKIRLILHKCNIGPSENVLSTYKSARGKYIAHLDGDDYFLPNKLQIQTDLMESETTCGMSFHACLRLRKDGSTEFDGIKKGWAKKERLYLDDLIQAMAVGNNSSKMFKRELLANFIDPGFPLVDTVFNCIILGDASVRFISGQALGVYREGIGVSSQSLAPRRATLQGYEFLSRKLPVRYRSNVCATVFLLLLFDLKNLRATALQAFKVWLNSFSPLFIFVFLKNINKVF